jgi:hypothetical protein
MSHFLRSGELPPSESSAREKGGLYLDPGTDYIGVT